MNPNGPFYGKCAYCEQKIYTDQYGDVEHYRPKGAVTEEDNRPVMVETGGEVMEHPGYYWLCYDWSNLLPACELCNRTWREGSGGRLIGKGNRFPVRDFRALRLGEEDYENPLLLHPVRDNPCEHLRIDELGVFHPNTDKGDMSIRILGLNDRELPAERRKVYEDVRNLVGMLLVEVLVNGLSLRARQWISRLAEIKAGRERFTAVARKALDDSRGNLSLVFGVI